MFLNRDFACLATAYIYLHMLSSHIFFLSRCMVVIAMGVVGGVLELVLVLYLYLYLNICMVFFWELTDSV